MTQLWSEKMNTFVTFKLDQESINELLVTFIRKYPLYFQEPERIKEIIYLFETKELDLVTMIIESETPFQPLQGDKHR